METTRRAEVSAALTIVMIGYAASMSKIGSYPRVARQCNASDEGKQAIFDGPESRTLKSNIRVTLCHCHENPLSEMDLEDEVFGKYIVTFQNKTPD